MADTKITDHDIAKFNKAIERLAYLARTRLYGREVVYGPDDSAIDAIAHLYDMKSMQVRDMVWVRLGMMLKGEA